VTAIAESRPVARDREKVTRRRLVCLFCLVITIPVGIVWRMAPLHLPQFAFKFGGSALWAVAVYWAVALLLPHARVLRLRLTAAIVALAVELAKLIWWPPLDHFRETLAGKLLLGRYFTVGAIVAYWLAILAVGALDALLFAHPGWRSNSG
jgi:hypothetical protein